MTFILIGLKLEMKIRIIVYQYATIDYMPTRLDAGKALGLLVHRGVPSDNSKCTPFLF
jgi:hypothetical protein